jgi:arginyl-tRNA synthetase
MIKTRLKQRIEETISSACRQGMFGRLESPDKEIVLTEPRHPDHGDYACAVALRLSAGAGIPAQALAESLARLLAPQISELASVEAAAPGYLNFAVSASAWQEVLSQIHLQGIDWGRGRQGESKTVLARHMFNTPDGKLRLEQARAAVWLSSLANLFRFCAFEVREEVLIMSARSAVDTRSRQALGQLLEKLKVQFDCICSAGSALPPAPDEKPAGRRSAKCKYDLVLSTGKAKSSKGAIKDSPDNQSRLEQFAEGKVSLSPPCRQSGARLRREDSSSLVSLIEELGPDTLRFYFSVSAPGTLLHLDRNLATDCRRANPAFLVRYAHAHARSLIRQSCRTGFDLSVETHPAISPEQWQSWLQQYKESPAVFAPLFQNAGQLSRPQPLVRQLADFDDLIEQSLLTRQPERLAAYASILALRLENFSAAGCLRDSDQDLTRARLGLIYCGARVLAVLLNLLGISTPESL